MASLNHIGNIKREFHHVKVLADGHEDYEPAMVLFKEGSFGKSFVIPLSAMWKYLDPKSNMDSAGWDCREFDNLAQRIYWRRQLAIGPARAQIAEDAAAIVYAEQMHEATGVMLCTAFSLFKACVLLGITVSPRSMSQLMMFIQDGLDDLKGMPPAEAENKVESGEAIIRIDGKTYHVPVETTATDLARDMASTE